MFDMICGTSGKAGNLKGAMQAGGNPFEGAAQRRIIRRRRCR